MKIKLKIKKALLAFLVSLSVCSSFGYAATITNDSPFYLHFQSGDASNCAATIAPGKSGSVTGYCGYDACSTNDFNSNGCQEFTNGNTGDETLTDGGYATYFGIGAYGSAPTCTIGATFTPYQCTIDANNHFSLVYKSIVQVYTQSGAPVVIPAVTHYTEGPLFRGVNISGLEYDGTFLDALFQHPDVPDARYFAAQGMNFIRLPIRAEFAFGQTGDPVTSTDPNPSDAGVSPNNIYLGAVYDTVQKYLAQGLSVDLDLHNYMRFCPTGAPVGQGNEPTDPVNNKCAVLTADQLANIWKMILTTPITVPGINGTVTFAQLAQEYAPNDGSYATPQLIFGIMNEPFDDSPAQPLSNQSVFENEVAAVKAIRVAAPNNMILLSGNGWDPLHAWMSNGDSDTFTRAALKAQGLETSNLVVEVHQYFDSNFSGLHQVCNHYANYQAFEEGMGVVDASGAVDTFSSWMQQNQMKVMLTEFGGADTLAEGSPNVDCRQDMSWMLQYVNAHAYQSNMPQNGGFIGWSAWRANRNGNAGFASFNYLQQKDATVYGAPSGGNNGIVQGPGNGLMTDVFAAYLSAPK